MIQKPQECKGCPMYYIGESFVPPKAGTKNEIVIVGEAPGEHEARIGQPFVGGSGRLLNEALQKANIRRDEVYVTNVMKCRPPDNKIPKDFDPSICAERYLSKELIQLESKKITIGLGSRASDYLFRKVPITRWRGSLVNSKFGKLMLAIHPSHIIRGQHKLFITLVLDLLKAKEYISNPDKFDKFKPNLIISPSLDKIREFTDDVLNEEPFLYFDIENTYSGVLISLSIAARLNRNQNEIYVLCVPILREGGKPYWNLMDEEQVWLCIHKMLRSISKKGAHFSNHDIGQLEDDLLFVENLTDDSYIAHHTLYSELSHKLEFLGSVYTPMEFWKSDKRESDDEKIADIDVPTEKMQMYNGKDSLGGLIALEEMWSELEEANLDKFYHEVQMPLSHGVRRVSRRGIRIDVNLMRDGYKKLELECDRITQMINEAAGYEINLSSPDQLAVFLFDDLGFTPTKFSKETKKPSTDETTLRKLMLKANEDQLIILRLILDHRGTYKIKGTYCNLKVDKDSKIRTKFKLGPVTGRWSSENPNLQTMPRQAVKGVDVRAFYIADEGHIFLCADHSQAELRGLAYHSKCKELIDCFTRGDDIHSLNTRKLYELSPDATVDKDGEQRAFAKIFVFLVSYLGGVQVLIDNALKYDIILSPEKSKYYINNYTKAYPEVKIYQDRVIADALETKVIYNSFGRRRVLFGSPDDIRGQAANYQIQSDIADLINRSFLQLDSEVPIVLQWHDALYTLVKNEPITINKTAMKMKEIMEQPVKLINGEVVVFPVDFKVGHSLSKMEKLKL